MGCTASSQAKPAVISQQPAAQTSNNASPSQRNDNTEAISTPKKETTIQPLVESPSTENSKSKQEDQQTSPANDAVDGNEKNDSGEPREEPVGEESKAVHQEPTAQEELAKTEGNPEQDNVDEHKGSEHVATPEHEAEKASSAATEEKPEEKPTEESSTPQAGEATATSAKTDVKPGEEKPADAHAETVVTKEEETVEKTAEDQTVKEEEKAAETSEETEVKQVDEIKES